uniref:Peptidase A1 domain-containing protein n=1 Tax=Leersia perrieri TaxID=77586 RepID=A0A0D9WKM1_9ORYZ
MEEKDRMRQRRVMVQVPQLMSNTSMFELPMRSLVNIARVGVYIVVVRIGTPALPYSLVLDTANELTWINCRLRRRKGKHPGRPHVPPAATTMSIDGGEFGEPPLKVIKNWYRPALSSTWRRFRCSEEDTCGRLMYTTCRSNNQTESCTYFQTTKDGTITSGIYGQEKATVAVSNGTLFKLPGLVIGCSTLEKGGAVETHDGILALGNHPTSFGVSAAMRFAGRFSFCLLATASDRNTSSYLTFGNNPAVEHHPDTMETQLIFNPDFNVGYSVRVTAVLVDGRPLDIPPEVWEEGSPNSGLLILDTGTSITGLVPAAYDALTAAYDAFLAPLLEKIDVEGFQFCYDLPKNRSITLPRLTIEMDGGARLEPDVNGVLIPDVSPGVSCLGFRRFDQGPMILGNTLMQEHIWEFDHMALKIRFRKDSCLHHPQRSKSSSSSPPSPPANHAA